MMLITELPFSKTFQITYLDTNGEIHQIIKSGVDEYTVRLELRQETDVRLVLSTVLQTININGREN